VRRQRRPTAALWLSAELLAQTVSYEESQSGGVAAALQMFQAVVGGVREIRGYRLRTLSMMDPVPRIQP
jgi:hypothetical protein